MSSSLLQVFVELGNLHGTWTLRFPSSTNTWRRLEDISAETLWNNNKDEDNSSKTLYDKKQVIRRKIFIDSWIICQR